MAIIKTTVNDKLEFDSAITELKEYFSSLGARKGKALTYNVLTYGCQLNESDSEKLSGMLLYSWLLRRVASLFAAEISFPIRMTGSPSAMMAMASPRKPGSMEVATERTKNTIRIGAQPLFDLPSCTFRTVFGLFLPKRPYHMNAITSSPHMFQVPW